MKKDKKKPLRESLAAIGEVLGMGTISRIKREKVTDET